MASRLHIKICEARNILKLSLGGSDPYVTIRLKSQDKKDVQKIQAIRHSTDSIWNQEFDIICSDPNDILVINMYDTDIKNDDKMMDELEFPVSTWPVGGFLDRQELDIELGKKNAGKFIFEAQSFPAKSGGDSCKTNQCKMNIKAFDANNVRKMTIGGGSDPYLIFGIKGKKRITTKKHKSFVTQEIRFGIKN